MRFTDGRWQFDGMSFLLLACALTSVAAFCGALFFPHLEVAKARLPWALVVGVSGAFFLSWSRKK